LGRPRSPWESRGLRFALSATCLAVWRVRRRGAIPVLDRFQVTTLFFIGLSWTLRSSCYNHTRGVSSVPTPVERLRCSRSARSPRAVEVPRHRPHPPRRWQRPRQPSRAESSRSQSIAPRYWLPSVRRRPSRRPWEPSSSRTRRKIPSPRSPRRARTKDARYRASRAVSSCAHATGRNSQRRAASRTVQRRDRCRRTRPSSPTAF
jgi:hypothetical protein